MLQQKVPDYTYETHFGGVVYLFCRGLSVGGGVFSDTPDAATIASLSDLLTEGGMG
jgi:exodeoxyribonuclease V beta subunit